MTNAELFGKGISLMFSGMGFVIIFLLLLIYAISFISIIINRYFPEPIPTTNAKKIPQSPHDDLEHLRPVIVAAIAHHRRVQGQH